MATLPFQGCGLSWGAQWGGEHWEGGQGWGLVGALTYETTLLPTCLLVCGVPPLTPQPEARKVECSQLGLSDGLWEGAPRSIV